MTHDVGSVPALRADRLGKRYGHAWGLRDCTFEVPPGSIVGLVGPNGAGKTTLLALTVGLLAPPRGRSRCSASGRAPRTPRRSPGSATSRRTIRCTGGSRWRTCSASGGRSTRAGTPGSRRRGWTALGIPLKRKVKSLSGGQQAQVALTLALAKRAPLLLLDEPVASLDPLARLDFMRDVLAASAESGLTVLIASHVIAELERLCDWLLVLNGGRLQLAGAVDDLLPGTRCSPCRVTPPTGHCRARVIERTDSDRHATGPTWMKPRFRASCARWRRPLA